MFIVGKVRGRAFVRLTFHARISQINGLQNVLGKVTLLPAGFYVGRHVRSLFAVLQGWHALLI